MYRNITTSPASGGGARLKKVAALPRSTSGKRHFQAALQHVGDGRQTAVEQDIACLGQRFLLQFDDVLERKIAAGDCAHQFQTLGFRKDQQRAAGDVAFEDLMDRDQVGDLPFGQDRDGAARGSPA